MSKLQRNWTELRRNYSAQSSAIAQRGNNGHFINPHGHNGVQLCGNVADTGKDQTGGGEMKQVRTPNYDKKVWTNRTNRTHKTPQKWDVIVNHIMEGYAPQTINYIDRPSVSVSAHFIIGRKGEIWRQADLKHGAWHCIKRNPSNKIVASRTAPPNLYTVGIEHEGMHKDTKGKLTTKQYEASLWVHKYIIERYEATFKEPFKIDREHIIGHYEVDTVNRGKADPGIEFPWDRLLSDLQKWDKGRKEVKKPVKKDLDIAQKWAVDNGIMQDKMWDEPATRHQMAWWLFDLYKKFIKEKK